METTQPEINWIGILLGFAFVGGLIFFIAYIEDKTKVKDLYYDKQRKLIEYAIMIFVSLSAIIWFMKSNKIDLFGEFALLGLLVKVVIAIVIGGEADKLGRNKYLWGFLAFLEFHFALIALGLGNKLFRVKGQAKTDILNLNKLSVDKESALNLTFKNGIINESQKEEKLTEIKSDYRIKLENILKTKSTDDYYAKLELALKNGIITQEEFETKRNKNEEG